MIPIALLNPDEELTYKNWAKEASIGDKDAEIELRDLIASLRSKIANFQLPFLYLEPDTPKEVAIEVFVKLNTRYVRLTAFDIVAARQKPPPFEAILVWKLSRFARNREDSIIYKSLLRKQGIQVVSINEPVEDTPSGRLLEGIIEVIDEFYSANLAQDVLRGQRSMPVTQSTQE